MQLSRRPSRPPPRQQASGHPLARPAPRRYVRAFAAGYPALLAVVTANLSQSDAAVVPAQRVDFSKHGSDWSAGSCGSRGLQSPMNFDDLLRPPVGSFAFDYADVHSGTVDLLNDGRTIFADLQGRNFGAVSLPMGTAPWYNLTRISFRAASEHTLRGKHAPLEVQLEHVASTGLDSTAGRQLVTVSVLIDCESPPKVKPVWPGLLQNATRPRGTPKAPIGALARDQVQAAASRSSMRTPDGGLNPALQAFVEKELPELNKKVTLAPSADKPVQLGKLLAGGSFFMYRGSQTLPPCDERVVWLVRREKVMASDAQVRALFERIYAMSGEAGNYRTIMPLNQRVVEVLAAKEQAVPVGMRDSPSAALAHEATTVAKQAVESAKALEARLTRDVQVHLPSQHEAVPSTASTTSQPAQPNVTWVAREMVRGVQQVIAQAVQQDIRQVLPAVASLTKSYLRQQLLHSAGFPLPAGPAPSVAMMDVAHDVGLAPQRPGTEAAPSGALQVPAFLDAGARRIGTTEILAWVLAGVLFVAAVVFLFMNLHKGGPGYGGRQQQQQSLVQQMSPTRRLAPCC